MASSSGANKNQESSGQTPAAVPSHPPTTRECESCRTAPGIPFCRVEWSFLCAGCAAVVHANSWVVSVTPNSFPNASLPHFPSCPFPYPFPFANPNNSDPNAVVHLSSEDDDLSPADVGAASGGKGRRLAPGVAASYRRLESVMRYREKRKSRRFEKTVRYENRRAYAELRPRVDGKFARREGGEDAGPLDAVDVVRDDPVVEVGGNVKGEELAAGYMGMDRISQLKPDAGGGLGGMVAGGEAQPDFIEDVRFP